MIITFFVSSLTEVTSFHRLNLVQLQLRLASESGRSKKFGSTSIRTRFGSCMKSSASEPSLIYGKTVILKWTELNQIVLKPCWYVQQLDRAMPAFKTCWINKASAPKVAQESGVRSKRNNGSVNSKRVHAPSPPGHLSGICHLIGWPGGEELFRKPLPGVGEFVNSSRKFL